MFDERNGRWISIYKGITIFLFFAIALYGLIGAIGDTTTEYLDIGLGGDDDGVADFMTWLLLYGFIAGIQLVINMLIINFLNNVQIIRETLERK